jgi:hypothetical protein
MTEITQDHVEDKVTEAENAEVKESGGKKMRILPMRTTRTFF